MLTSGSLVQVDKNGARKRVEDLIISDLVFNPWSGRYVEIIDILSRGIELDATEISRCPVRPVIVPKGAVSANRPAQDICVSPGQGFFIAVPGMNGKPAKLAEVMARDLPGISLAEVKRNEILSVKYFAIFTGDAEFMDVSGMLVSTFTPEVFRSPGSHRENISGVTKISSSISVSSRVG